MRLEAAPGSLTDHDDTVHKIVRLSESNSDVPSVSAVSVAAHEVGHAIQDKLHLPALTLWARLLPVLNLGPWLVLGGVLLQFSGLIWVGVVAFACAVLFHLITLKVEFDASRCALAYLGAAACTAFATSVAQLLSFVGLARSNDR